MIIGGNIDVRLNPIQFRRPSAGWGPLRLSVSDDRRDRHQPALVRRWVAKINLANQYHVAPAEAGAYHVVKVHSLNVRLSGKAGNLTG